MPLEIRELIIKATVDDNGTAEGSAADNADHNASLQSQQDTIVNLCVEKVLEILKEKSER